MSFSILSDLSHVNKQYLKAHGFIQERFLVCMAPLAWLGRKVIVHIKRLRLMEALIHRDLDNNKDKKWRRLFTVAFSIHPAVKTHPIGQIK